MNIEGINQIQTNSEIGLTFATALRSILRQDPNIIMVGEIRDTETAKIAVRASITGHLVLSTIHTNNSLNTIERLLDMGVERYLLASSLEGVISQVLARKLCPHCRTLRKTNIYEKQLFKDVLNKDIEEIYTTEGCEQCGNGYAGRIAIHEVLLFNQDIRDAISAGVRRDKLRELVYQSDVNTLLEDGLEKVLMGLTTVEEVIKLIELEDDEKGSKAYGLKSALSNTAMTKDHHKTFSDIVEKKNEIDDIINSDSATVKVNDIDNSQNNTYSNNEQTNSSSENTSVEHAIPNEINTITYQEPTTQISYSDSQNQSTTQENMPQTLNDLINKANKN